MDLSRSDSILMEILEERKTIAGFFDAVFGFLSRNTDFYYDQENKDEQIGFPPGMREQIVLKVLQKFDPKFRYATDTMEVSPAINEVEVPTTACEEPESETDASEDEEEKEEKVEKEEVVVPFAAHEYKNGACFETYCWAQTPAEIELHIRLPKEIKSSKEISIKIDSININIISKLNPDDIPIFNGKLIAKIKQNDVLWTMSGNVLQITLDKVTGTWWDRLLESESPINTNKIDCSREISDLPMESQAAIHKLQWEQQQKEAGIPTETERDNLKKLRAAWDAEGSPFKGQPFDPSMVKFN